MTGANAAEVATAHQATTNDNVEASIIRCAHRFSPAGVFARPKLDRHIRDPAAVAAALAAAGVGRWTPRLTSFALAAGAVARQEFAPLCLSDAP